MKLDKTKFRYFDNEEYMRKWGEKYYPEEAYIYKDMKNAMTFFEFYTGNADRLINNALRQGKDISSVFSYGIITKEMYESALNAMFQKPIPESIVVYRKINKTLLKGMLEWSGVSKLRKNMVIYDRGFISTSLNKYTKNTNYDMGHIVRLIIYVPKNTPGIYLENMEKMGEFEILFPPAMKLKVIHNFFGKIIECVIENK